MRFLIVSALFACAAASHIAAPYALAPAAPTISAGDINGAFIEAHAEAADHARVAYDHARAAYDANRQVHDKVNELHGQAVNAAEEHAWRHVDAVKTVEARLDGAAAATAPAVAKHIARSSPIVAAPVAPIAPIAQAPVIAAPAPVAIPAPVAPVYAEPTFYQPAFYNSFYQPYEYAQW